MLAFTNGLGLLEIAEGRLRLRKAVRIAYRVCDVDLLGVPLRLYKSSVCRRGYRSFLAQTRLRRTLYH